MKKYLHYIALVVMIWGCKKPPEPQPTADAYEKGILILNEGLFGQNNASISFYDGTKSYHQAFKEENDRGLGDTANDFEAFNIFGKSYIIAAIDVSSQIEIINQYTLKSVARIPVFDGENAREPRRIVVDGTTAYVCNFDGTVAIIDLINFEINLIIEVGANPDGLLLKDDRLFVSNSGGLLYPEYDSTVTVINKYSGAVITEFKTRINCGQLVADNEDDIYLVSRGNHEDIEPALLRIDATSYIVEEEINIPASSLFLKDDWMYFYHGENERLQRFNSITEEMDETGIIDFSGFDNFAGVHYNEVTEEIYAVDANGYVNSSTVYVYDFNGNLKYEFTAGLNATDFIYNN